MKKHNLPKIDTYKILSDCVEQGIKWGIHDSYKHLNEGDCPEKDFLLENTLRCIMNEICEKFNFNE
jgi:hypothetical protein